MARIVFLNTTILTVDGKFELTTWPLEQVKAYLSDCTYPRLSAVGHESTAQILSSLLGEDVAVNRIQFAQESEDVCICFKLKGRAPEGKILTEEEVEAIGYEFKMLTML